MDINKLRQKQMMKKTPRKKEKIVKLMMENRTNNIIVNDKITEEFFTVGRSLSTISSPLTIAPLQPIL